jgi:hypothetical protein
MGNLTDAEIDAAKVRGAAVRSREARAVAARYDRPSKNITVDLINGCVFAFPARLVEGLGSASDDELSGLEILGDGYGLHWEALDVDISVPGLLANISGTSAFMARQAGKSRSPAKAEAARSNGAKGGRPRKAG